jgi:hypothetical protein
MSGMFSTVGVWGYGLAAVGFSVFLGGLVAARRLPAQPGVLLAALAASAAWATAGTVYAFEGGTTWWTAHVVLDLLRIGLWFALLATVFRPATSDVPHATGPFGRWRWALAAAALVVAAILVLSPPRLSSIAGAIDGSGSWSLAAMLGVTIFGLALIEHLLRNADEAVRWRLKPLLLALGSAFAFDLLVFSEAFLFRVIDANLWAARGAVNLLVLPFVAVTVARSKAWTPGVTVSRGVVFHSVALVGAGVYLLAIRPLATTSDTSAAAGARPCRRCSSSAHCSSSRWSCSPAPSALVCGFSSASTSSRIATTTAKSGCGSPAGCRARRRT